MGKIISIKKIDNTSKRYDIEVEDNNNFYANGILVHNCETMKKEINQCYEDGELLGFTLKRDGSSVTCYCKKAPIEEGYQTGICSRKQEKKLDQKQIVGYKDIATGTILNQYYNKDLKVRGWQDILLGTFYTDEEINALVETEAFEPIEREVKDAWIDTCKAHGYFEKFVNYCKKYDVELALRGELIGQGNKGSGNKLNQDAQGVSRVVWFGVDDLSSGFAKRINYSQEHNLMKVCEELEMDYTKHVLRGIMPYESIIKECHKIFEEIENSTGQVVEGIVIRTINSNKLSVKYINPKYDAKS